MRLSLTLARHPTPRFDSAHNSLAAGADVDVIHADLLLAFYEPIKPP
jgi:hypothetical protein